jgi:hypothetical protein
VPSDFGVVAPANCDCRRSRPTHAQQADVAT